MNTSIDPASSVTVNLLRFQQLAREGAPLQQRIAEISLEQVQLSHREAIEIVKAAFPNAKILEVVPLAEIKPSDFAKAAQTTVEKIYETGATPGLILIDNRRFLITLAQ